jgi:hypothetical protein
MKRDIKTIADVKSLEHQSKDCSSKYVPIKSSEFINELKDFDFNGGFKYRSGSTAHQIKMSQGNDVNLLIENSFDRSLALRISFEYKGFVFGRIKQKYMGEPAKELNNVKTHINDWYRDAIKTVDSMKTLTLDMQDMKNIVRIAMKTRGVNSSEVQGVIYNQSNALDFVTDLVQGIRDGAYDRVSLRGLKEIKGVKRESLMIEINYNIWKFLAKNNPELQI